LFQAFVNSSNVNVLVLLPTEFVSILVFSVLLSVNCVFIFKIPFGMDFKLGVLRVEPIGVGVFSVAKLDAVFVSAMFAKGVEWVVVELASFESALFNLLFFLFLQPVEPH
jgi:hypothetical protein